MRDLVLWLAEAAGFMEGALPEIIAISAAGIAVAAVAARKSRRAASRIVVGSLFVALAWTGFKQGSGHAFLATDDFSVSLLAGLVTASVIAVLGGGALVLWRPKWVAPALVISIVVLVETPGFLTSMLSGAHPESQQASSEVTAQAVTRFGLSAEVLGPLADRLNKSLPVMVDSGTELVSTEGLANTFVFKYRLVNYVAHKVSSTWLAELPSAVRRVACTMPEVRDDLLGNGVTVRYVYTGRDRVQVASIEVAPGDCDPGLPRVSGSASTRDSANPQAQMLLVNGSLLGKLDRVKTALANGADVNEPWGTNLPLYWAATENQIEVVKFLLDAGADIDGRSGVAQRSALHEAALDGNFDLVRVLVEAGANVNIRNTHDRTPLYYVTSPPAPLSKPPNAETIAEFLVAHGATL